MMTWIDSGRLKSPDSSQLEQLRAVTRVVKVFAVEVITRDFTTFLPAGKNTFGHGNKWQKLNFGMGCVLSAVL